MRMAVKETRTTNRQGGPVQPSVSPVKWLSQSWKGLPSLGSLSKLRPIVQPITAMQLCLRTLASGAVLGVLVFTSEGRSAPEPLPDTPAGWRAGHRLIDLHQHVDFTPEHLERAVRIMDAVGLGLGINLSGGTVTRKGNTPSEFERNKDLADRLFPGRFLEYVNLDYTDWNEPDFSERAVKQIEKGYRLGAAGFKEWKRLGLYLRDKSGALIKIDDPKLDPVWKRCGELGLPVSIHVADPKAFWLPYDKYNERWTELKDHRNWWFGDPKVYPPREELLAARNRVVARHPETTFVCVHFANNPEDVDQVDQWLDRYPNMMVDLAARIPELGRHDPEKVHRLFVKHQDRIFFATDFMVYDRLTLGSGGSGPAPTDEDAHMFYEKHWQWMETWDQDFKHMTPIQGDWTISGIGLPKAVLRKIYFDNARKLLARSLPTPVLKAARIREDFQPDGDLAKAVWENAQPEWLDRQSVDGAAKPEVATLVRALWSDTFLYLGYECPCAQLTTFEPPRLDGERIGLWDRDVVEAFIGSDTNHTGRYAEFEVAPTNEKLDLTLDLPERDFKWSSQFVSATRVDQDRKVWTCEMRIPLTRLSSSPPALGARWRLNLYRCDHAHQAFLAWNPTLVKTFHEPKRFGVLEFSR
jgi:predicted TIM-barrel fold metal-dependent hydrolase